MVEVLKQAGSRRQLVRAVLRCGGGDSVRYACLVGFLSLEKFVNVSPQDGEKLR